MWLRWLWLNAWALNRSKKRRQWKSLSLPVHTLLLFITIRSHPSTLKRLRFQTSPLSKLFRKTTLSAFPTAGTIGKKTHWFGQGLCKDKEAHNRQWRLRLSDSSIFDISCWSVAKNSTLLKVKAENFPIFVVLPLWIGHGNGNKTVKFGWNG